MRRGLPGGGPPGKLSVILKKYGSEQNSPLEFDIKTDGQVVDLELE